MAHRRNSIFGASKIEAEGLQRARHVAADDEAKHGATLGRGVVYGLLGSDHAGLRDLERRPDRQRNQQAADCSCPRRCHVYSWEMIDGNDVMSFRRPPITLRRPSGVNLAPEPRGSQGIDRPIPLSATSGIRPCAKIDRW